MTTPEYTRYTLRLPVRAAHGPGAAPPAAGTLAGAAPDADDDWSGTPRASGPDAAELDYAHPDAVALVSGIAAGWQELDGGDTLVFWMREGGEEAGPALRALARLGRLEKAPESPGWEEAWKAFHTPQVVGRLHIRPPWEPPRDDLIDLAIETGMAFGTGGHVTTRQCLQELQRLPRGSLLDVGYGTGVVALAAMRLGFSPVWGIDIDPLAREAAAANAARNHLAPVFTTGDATDPSVPLPDVAVAVANIALGPILRLAERLRRREPAAEIVRPERLLLAGLLVRQRDETLAAFSDYRLAAARDDGEWLLLSLEAA